MDTKTFLSRVLPSDGNYCAWVAAGEDGKPKQRLFSGVEDLADFLRILSGQGLNVYYAVSSFGDKKTRKSDNVLSTKLFALDIDVGKVSNSYATAREALTALKEYISASGMPMPMVVASGAGFHVYWVLTEALTPDKWLPIAEALKQSVQAYGLVIDPTVTADLSRVLRPVGCMHQGKQKVVELLIDAEPVDPAYFASMLPIMQASKRPALLDSLKVEQDRPKSEAGAIVNKCRQVGWGVANQGETNEPFWYALMGIAAYTTTPEETAIAWSEQHPAYSERNTLDKLEQWRKSTSGPATCTRLEALRSGGCKGCPFAGKVTTPVQLGTSYEEVTLDEEEVDSIAVEVPIPAPYKRTIDGIKVRMDDVDFDVCSFDVYPLGYGHDETLGYETVRFKWKRPHHGWEVLSLRSALLVDGNRDFSSHIADMGITLPTKKQTEMFQRMLRSYMDELKRVRSLTNLYQTMGWKVNFSQFVLGDTIVKQDANGNGYEEHVTLSKATTRIGEEMYGTAGSVEAWSKGTSILELGEMPWHMFALGMGFSAPLFAFTGLKGMTVSLYGPTGGGKTLIQYWIQSIYGDPDKLHFAAKFTQNSLFNRLSIYNNLPMTIDEATMFQDKEVSDFLYWVSQGKDKARLTRSSEEREAKSWSTPVIVSTNKSLQTKLIASGLETGGLSARLLEISVPSHKLFSKNSLAGQKVYKYLTENYGLVGREYLKELVRMGPDKIRAMIENAKANFSETYKVKFSGEERFWEQAVVLQDIGSQIAKRLGLISYDPKKGTEWVLSQLGAIRKTAEENKSDCFELLSEYLTQSAGASVTLLRTGTMSPVVDHSRVPRGEVRVRYELYRDKPQGKFTKGTLLVSKSHLRKWLSEEGVDFKSFMFDMEGHQVLNTPKCGKAYLAKDTPAKHGQVSVVGFNLNHEKLEGILNDIDEANEQFVARHLTLVDNKGE